MSLKICVSLNRLMSSMKLKLSRFKKFYAFQFKSSVNGGESWTKKKKKKKKKERKRNKTIFENENLRQALLKSQPQLVLE